MRQLNVMDGQTDGQTDGGALQYLPSRAFGEAGDTNRSPGRPGRGVRLNNEKTGGVAVAFNPPTMVSGNVDVGVTPLVGGISSILPEVVFPMVAEGAPLADHVDKVLIDSVGVSPLAMAGRGGGLSPGVAGAASLAVAGVTSLAIAELASSDDLAGMTFLAFAGVASPTDLAGMAFPAVAGAAPLAVVEVASSTDLMEAAGSPSVYVSQFAYDCLVPDKYVNVPDVVVFPERIELGDPTVVVPPMVRTEMSVTKDCHRSRDVKCTQGRALVDMCPEEQELLRENNGHCGWSGWLGSSLVSDWLGRGH